MISSAQQDVNIDLLLKYKPRMVGIFGSYARGENDEKSDLDILVDFEKSLDLLELIGLEQELTENLGIKVDLITAHSLSPQLKHYVEKDLIPLVKWRRIRLSTSKHIHDCIIKIKEYTQGVEVK